MTEKNDPDNSLQPPDMWIIYCPLEEEEKEAEKVGLDYQCSSCGRKYGAEDVAVYNPAVIEYYRQQYKGYHE